MKKIFITIAALVLFSITATAQDATIYLWRNIKGMEKQPSVMFMHKPSEDVVNTHTAVIVCPGGSYHHLGLKGEGNTTATWFAENGVTAFVLKYRTAESFYHHPAMLQDIQRAIQLVRENAEEWDINPEKVGIIGFSAGGHLVTMAGEFWQTHDEIEKLGIECQVSLRPDFVIPVPDSSIPAAIGYSRASGIPYGEGLIKNRYVGRTFIMPTQEERELAVRLKLNPIKEAIKGKKIILIDDSIVRGTTSKKLLDLVKESEPAEIHFLVGCPPVVAPCFYGVAMATKKELIAANYSIEEIKEQLDIDTLGYITLGQPSTTLSGGEAQRIKLATELSRKDTGNTLYILDEPTTGLHFEDIRILLSVLQKLVDKGNTMVVIEHNLDVIKVADYLIDMGEKSGSEGGRIAFTGTPEQAVKDKNNSVGIYLKDELNSVKQKN